MSQVIKTNFLNVKEVSVFLKLSALTIYKYIGERKIRAIHVGGRYLIEKSSLDKFVKNRKLNKNFSSFKSTQKSTGN